MTTEEPTWLHQARKKIAEQTEIAEGSTEHLLKLAVEAFDSVANMDAKLSAMLDLETHRDAWRKAIEISRGHARIEPPDVDDKTYWDHELRAFDRSFDALIGSEPVAGPKP
jgi:hypothetical protein